MSPVALQEREDENKGYNEEAEYNPCRNCEWGQCDQCSNGGND